MSDLLTLLSFGARSIAATNASITVTANNIANANTDGYSRESVGSDGKTVRVSDNILAGRIQTAAGSLAMSQAFADALAELEGGLTTGGSLDEQVGAMFAKVGSAAASPTDPTSRGAVVAAARALVGGIHARAASMATALKESDARIRDHAVAATSLAKQLAATNAAFAKTGAPAAADARDKIAKQLGQLVGGQARIDHDGQMRYVLEGGAVLVDGKHAAALAATSDRTTGLAKLEIVDGNSRRDVTPAISGGAIGGQLAIRDHTIPQITGKLDQLAYDVTTSMNTVHSANAGLDGVTGRPMFTPLTQVAGAAGAMAIDPALDADPSLLALGAPGGGAGDNRGALALFALGTQSVASGGTRTLGDASLDIVSDVALAGADAQGAVTRDNLISDHLSALRDSLAGVDSQEELTNLARFEHASTAMTKVVSTIDDMLSSLIQNL